MCNNMCDYVTISGREIKIKCGDTTPGMDVALCNDCFRKAVKKYPQGWRNHPGDVCPHGKYVGGSGADFMCGICETN